MTQEQKSSLATASGAQLKKKRPYRKPNLTRFGDIRSKTLSPTITFQGESGNQTTYSYQMP